MAGELDDDVVDDVVEDNPSTEVDDEGGDITEKDFIEEDGDGEEDPDGLVEGGEKEEDPYVEEDKNLKVGRVNFTDLKKEFPDVLKKYPELRDVVHRDRAFTEVFGTVEEAKEASQKVAILEYFDKELSTGNASVLVNNLNGGPLEAFAERILPALHSKSPDLFVKATEPVLKRILNSAFQAGTNSKDENLSAAAQVLHKFLFNDYKITPATQPKQDDRLVQERQRLEQERQGDIQSLKSYAGKEFDEMATSRLERMISKDLDADENLTPLMKKYIMEQTIQSVDEKLMNDPHHMANMRAIWKKAEKGRYNRQEISQAINAYLGRAQRLIGPARAKLRAEALGRKSSSVTAKRVSGGSASSGASKSLDPKKIDWKKFKNDTDFLNRG